MEGKTISASIHADLRTKISAISGRKPKLVVVIVGNDPASHIYVNRKTKGCEDIGMESLKIALPDTTTQEKLLDTIHRLNCDPAVDGILVQLPLPKQINPSAIIMAIDPEKDVDGFHPLNLGKLLMGEKDGFIACTPLGISVMLDKYGIDVKGKHVVILGRSVIVGKPMAALLMQNAPGANATVTLAHRFSQNVAKLCRSADILITAVGIPRYITETMVKEGAVVLDIGMHKIDGKLCGDVDFQKVKDKCSYITPVPGGVGPMTIAMLLCNTYKAYKASSNK